MAEKHQWGVRAVFQAPPLSCMNEGDGDGGYLRYAVRDTQLGAAGKWVYAEVLVRRLVRAEDGVLVHAAMPGNGSALA